MLLCRKLIRFLCLKLSYTWFVLFNKWIIKKTTHTQKNQTKNGNRQLGPPDISRSESFPWTSSGWWVSNDWPNHCPLVDEFLLCTALFHHMLTIVPVFSSVLLLLFPTWSLLFRMTKTGIPYNQYLLGVFIAYAPSFASDIITQIFVFCSLCLTGLLTPLFP